MLPEQFLTRIHQKITAEWKWAFFTAFLVGLLIHLYRLANPLLTWDSLYNFHDPQNTIHLGRCFLTISCGISSYFDLPAVNGLLSLLYISLAAVCLTEIFELKDKLSIFLVSAMTVAFPTVTSTLLYMYTADGYFLAMFCAALAVLITLKYRKGFIPGLILLAFSYGSYQAYISYAVMLILSWSILRLLFMKQNEGKDFWKQLGRFAVMGIGGTLLYLISNKLLTALEGIETSSYQGVSNMKIPGFSELLHAVPAAVTEFVYFFFGPLDAINLFKILNILLFVVLFFLLVCIIKRTALWKTPLQLFPVLVCFGLLPFGCCLIYFVTPDVRYHMLMMMGFSLIYLLPVLLSDRLQMLTAVSSAETSVAEASAKEASVEENSVAEASVKEASVAEVSLKPDILYRSEAQLERGSTPLLSWAVFLLSALTIYNFALIGNITYMHAHQSYEKTYALTSRMADRLEQTEGFENVSKLCVIGHFENSDKISINFPPNMTGIKEGYLATEQNHFAAFFDLYLGLTLDTCSEEEQSAFRQSSDVEEMGVWPEKDSIKIIEDVIIIKLSKG